MTWWPWRRERTRPLYTSDDLDALDREQDIRLKRIYGSVALGLACGQVIAADVGFFFYGFRGGWERVPPEVMNAWLGATVVQVLGIMLVVTQYLFPKRAPAGTMGSVSGADE